MKYILPLCILLALSFGAYGQQPGGIPQVTVHLQVVEVSLTKLQRIGFDLTKLSGDPNGKSNTDQASDKARSSFVLNDGIEAQRVLGVLRKDNLARVLAEPTLVALSGKTTVFNSGDKLPIPKPRQDGSMAIEYQYGTVVELTPEVMGDKVRLAIHGRLAELDYGHMVRVGKETVPGVHTREFTTRTELKSGQTLAISGLTQVRMEAVNRGVPYLSEIPYVGALIRSVKEERNDIATFIFVRPEIVQSPAALESLIPNP